MLAATYEQREKKLMVGFLVVLMVAFHRRNYQRRKWNYQTAKVELP